MTEQHVLLEDEPWATQEGVDVAGFARAAADLVNYGVFNGNFALGTPLPDPALVDVSKSESGSNFLPGWRFVQSSNTNITGIVVRNTASPGGSNFRFMFAGGSVGDAAFIEQILDVGGERAAGTSWHGIRAWATGTMGENAELRVRVQALNSDGTIVGMPPEAVQAVGSIEGELQPPPLTPTRVQVGVPALGAMAGSARYLRVRIEAARVAYPPSTGRIDLMTVRRLNAAGELYLWDWEDPDGYMPLKIRQEYGQVYILPENGGANGLILNGTAAASQDRYVQVLGGHVRLIELSAHPAAPVAPYRAIYARNDGYAYTKGSSGTRRLFDGQLLALPFSLLNVPDDTTTSMQPADNALGFNTPRWSCPWGGSFVGVSYRSNAISAGHLQVVVSKNGASVWTPFTLTSASSLSGEETQAPGTDTFSAGNALGIEIVTNAAFAPTTLDISVLLWILVDYNGA